MSGKGQPTAEEIRAEIEQTRSHLSDTIDILAARLDVKARVSAEVSATRLRVLDFVAAHRYEVIAAGVGVVGGVVALVLTRRGDGTD